MVWNLAARRRIARFLGKPSKSPRLAVPLEIYFVGCSRNDYRVARESLGLKQSRRESAVRGKPIKFQSESITADLCLGVAIAGINILIGIGLIIVFM